MGRQSGSIRNHFWSAEKSAGCLKKLSGTEIIPYSPSGGWSSRRRGRTRLLHSLSVSSLIHVADPRSWSALISISIHVSSSVPSNFKKSSKEKQFSSLNSACYWRSCMTGRVDHWWPPSLFSSCCLLYHHNLKVWSRKKEEITELQSSSYFVRSLEPLLWYKWCSFF